jgi:hypothetical protein
MSSAAPGFRGVPVLNLPPLKIKGSLPRQGVNLEPHRTPYPWCRGNPTYQDCINAGYCKRDPNCGE